jgi:catechol 2,3-dioxygenase-like lactoylglutathione lyase family enzyme
VPVAVSDLWVSDVGIRVTDLRRSVEFYTKVLGLEELVRAADDDSAYVLLRERRSGQRIELNWYSEENPFWSPYHAGEGLDHIEVRVRSVREALERLRVLGIAPATRELWTNRRVVERMRADPEQARKLDLDVWTTSAGHSIVYIRDPDGLFLCLYDHPEERWDDPVPDHY